MDTKSPPHIGVPDASTLRSLSGFDFLSRIASGELPAPPISRTLGIKLASLERGSVTFRGTPDASVLNPIGSIHGGYAATILDSCMGCAVHTMLDAGVGYTTLELKVNYVRGLTATSGEVRAIGTVLHVGRRSALAEGRILDSGDRLIAHATTTCLVFPL